jgi:outer membrane protein TolC
MQKFVKIMTHCKNTNIVLALFLVAGLCLIPGISSAETKTGLPKLSLKEFIQRATANDVTFETILIDQLPLAYRRDLLLPDSDVIMDVKYQYNFYLDQDRSNPETSISLSKLFPYNGTRVSLSYSKSSSAVTATDDSSLQFLISQPIAQNAFGKGTRLQDKIIGIEDDISRYQIVEAYEDYLASLSAAYYNWYSAYENLKVGQASYKSNQKLLANILERQRQNIALPIDVNKMELLLIGKRENVIILQEIYDSFSNLIFQAIRHSSATPYVPVKPARPAQQIQFDTDYQAFTQHSRTYRALRLLEEQGTLEVKKAADDLLPSTNLLLGYQLDGEDWGIRNQEDSFFAGFSLNWPIGKTSDKARHQLARIERKKTVLSNQDKYADLHTNLKNLYLQIRREQKLIAVAEKKIRLAEAILKDEAENYSFGRVTLNDYIDAVNLVDDNRFSYTDRIVQLNKLLVEWLRLTDQLVGEEILDNPPVH